VLIINPLTNTTDITTLGGLGSGSAKWIGITYAADVGKLYAAPQNADAVLIIDPLTNTTDITTLTGFGSGGDNLWRGITYAANMGKLYAVPCNAAAVLVVGFGVDASALLPFRLITELTNTIISTQATVSSMQVSHSSTEAALVSTQMLLVSTQAALSSIEAEVNSVRETVCNQPVCAAGTQAVNGTCVPDCSDLRRRGVQCEPFCDAADVVKPWNNGNDGGNESSSSSSSSSVPIWIIVVIVLGVALVIAVITISIQRARHASHQAKHKASPQQQPTIMTMFMNPIHPGFASSDVAKDQFNDDFQEPPRDIMKLDSELYVQPADCANANDATYEAPYSLFQAPSDAANNNGDYESVLW
jgi:hypothetical protein